MTPAIDGPAPAAAGLSVIIPVYGDWTGLPQLLARIAAEIPHLPQTEVILVDNAPLPAPQGPEVPAALTARFRRLHCPRPGSYAARNAGAAAATGRRFVFVDADCRPGPGWLAAIARADAATPRLLLAGPVRVEAGPAPNDWEIYDMLRGIPQERYIRHGYATTANLSVPAPVFRALGGFDASRLSGGDAAFCRRAGAAGHGLRLVPDAIVSHAARSSRAEAVTKARRVKGGQVAAGPRPRRIAWTLRSLAPPLREIAAYWRMRDRPRRHRRIASRLRLVLWGEELREIARLLVLRRPPERR